MRETRRSVAVRRRFARSRRQPRGIGEDIARAAVGSQEASVVLNRLPTRFEERIIQEAANP
jgi:hypothetical protein